MPRSPCIHHCTSEPYRFFGRDAELALLHEALGGGPASVVALVGPGGQGKTAIMQHWLGEVVAAAQPADGVFLWSFYRGKDADLCLRELYAYAEDLAAPPDVSASYCVDHLLPILRRERWALVLDGTEVVQYDSGDWFGRFVHPELGRLLEELASSAMPGVVVITSRFALPDLERRRHARVLGLTGLDPASARGLLQSVRVHGTDPELDAAATLAGHHAKAVELLGTYLVRFAGGAAARHADLPDIPAASGASDEEQRVARILSAYQAALPLEAQDMLALATAFRDPPTQARLGEYLISQPVHDLLHATWRREYVPFAERPTGWIAERLDELVALRLLERVKGAGEAEVIDAHPLVRRSFEHVLGVAGRRESSQARAGFLRGRPDRRRPDSLEEAREEVELFHAYCDAGLWQEADAAYAALDNPRYRFVAPAFERDLLLRFFPVSSESAAEEGVRGDWRQPPLWRGFARHRALAICFELLGNFEDAIAAYRAEDAPLRGDALIALGRLAPLLEEARPAHPWNILWQAYRAHALCLAGEVNDALTLAGTLVPTDVYEWTHVFECLLRLNRLDLLDMHSFLYRPPRAAGNRWSDLARQRMRLDYLRVTHAMKPQDLQADYVQLLDAYDRGGLPWERVLARLSHGRVLMDCGCFEDADAVVAIILEVSQAHGMRILEADGRRLESELARRRGQPSRAAAVHLEASRLRGLTGYRGPDRP